MKAKASSPDKDLSAVITAGGSRSRFGSWLLRGLIVLALGAGAWFVWGRNVSSTGQATPYITEPVRQDDVTLVVTATGNLEPTNEVTVGSELSGIVIEVFVDTNDVVKKGQPLARLDTTKLTQQTESSRARVTSANAGVKQAEATLKEAQATLARRQELHRLSKGEVPSKAEMDTAEAAADRAAADLNSALASVGETEAQVKINENDLAKAIIKSPIDGVVLKRSVEPGQTVAASFTAPELFVIAENLEHMKLKVAVAEADIGRLGVKESGGGIKQRKATFTVDAWPDRFFTASVTRVAFGSVLTDNVVTYETELQVANSDLSLRPGMTATADIEVAESKDVLVVPTAALRFDPNAATAAGGPPQRSFMQTLMPGPGRGGRRGGGGGGPSSGGKDEAKPTATPGIAKVWILKDGKPEPLPVKTGISDGRFTEVSGEGVTKDLPVIVRAMPAAP